VAVRKAWPQATGRPGVPNIVTKLLVHGVVCYCRAQAEDLHRRAAALSPARAKANGGASPGFPVRPGGVNVADPRGMKRGFVAEIRVAPSKNISKKGPRNCRSLGCARDDKGESGASIETVAEQKAFFISLGGPQAHVHSVESHCPQRLKPHQFCLLYVRAEARTLQPIFMHLGGAWAHQTLRWRTRCKSAERGASWAWQTTIAFLTRTEADAYHPASMAPKFLAA
jgi:hypothetical protein